MGNYKEEERKEGSGGRRDGREGKGKTVGEIGEGKMSDKKYMT